MVRKSLPGGGGAVPYHEHAVVQLGPARRVEHAAGVLLERGLVRLDRHGNGPARDRGAQRGGGVRRDVGVAAERRDDAGRPVRARVVQTDVGVVPLAVDAAVGQDVGVGLVHVAARAAVVAGPTVKLLATNRPNQSHVAPGPVVQQEVLNKNWESCKIHGNL